MELGETICIPNGAPKCELCPLASLCRAKRAGEAGRYPVKSPPKARRIEPRTVLLLRCGDRYAVRKRAEGGLLAGLWEFPALGGALDAEAAKAAVRTLGGCVLSCTPCGETKHVFTHVEWHMTGYALTLEEELPGLVWKTAADIRRDCPIPTALRYYLKKLN